MKLYYREEGKRNKQIIVIVHGLYGSSDNWLTVGKKLGKKYLFTETDLMLEIGFMSKIM